MADKNMKRLLAAHQILDSGVVDEIDNRSCEMEMLGQFDATNEMYERNKVNQRMRFARSDCQRCDLAQTDIQYCI